MTKPTSRLPQPSAAGGSDSPRPRPYDRARDYAAVGDFLVRTFSARGPHPNWLQPRWEYMHFHPLLDEASLVRAGVWERGGAILAVVHHEHRLGEVYFEVAAGSERLKPAMLDYALEHLAGENDRGPYLAAFIDGRDREFHAAARARGFGRTDKGAEPMSALALGLPLPEAKLPPGFRIGDLEQDDDLLRFHRLLHRGFNHLGEPDPADLPGRSRMQEAPNYRRDLNVVVKAPGGDFVALCGMWFVPVRRVAYVEPVCTDPDFRRKGLGRAAVTEGLRRCAALGARTAYVGATLPVYRSVGFEKIYTQYRWVKQL